MMTRVADIVAETLAAFGIRHAYGMPGGEVVTLLDGLDKAGIAFHLARHETAAALMAAGSSVVSGTPGLLVTTVGPGLANAVNGIADASQEHVPLVVISGIVDRQTRARYTHQVIDHAALLRPLVKASFEIEAESAGQTVARAIAIATTEPMGPVHLDLSPATAAAEAKPERKAFPPITSRPAISADDPAIKALSAQLAASRRPLIIAGFEAARDGAGEALAALAERISAPILTTYKGKGVVPESHPLALGGAGLSPKADAILLGLVRQADLVLMVGYDPIEMRLGWMDPATESATVIEMTAAPTDHAMHQATHRFVASPRAAAAALALAVPERSVTWPGGEPAAAKAALVDAFTMPSGFGPHAIVTALQAEAGRGDIVTVDSGAHRILLSQLWKAERPLTLLQSAGFCTMAAALPLAIGAQVAAPGSRVFAVMGDGGLEMGIGELATLRDLDLPVTVLVFQDRSLALIAMKQTAAGLGSLGVALGETDFARIAEGFGGHGVTVAAANDLRDALAATRDRRGFSLIACRFDEDAYQDAF